MAVEALLALAPLITGAMSSFGANKEGQGKAKYANHNALLSEQKAQAIQQASDWNLMMIARKKAKFQGTQRALYASAGVRFEGSVIEGMAESATEFELDAISERYNSQIQIMSAKSEASNWRMMADNYRREGRFKAGMTLLSSAASVGMNYAAGAMASKPSYGSADYTFSDKSIYRHK